MFGSYLNFIIISSLLIFLDQISKKIVIEGFRFKSLLLDIVLLYNPGSAFGIKIMDNNQYIIVNSIVLTIFSLLLIRFIKNSQNSILSKYYYYSLIFILSGGIGNLIDRFIYGKVVDFISILSFLKLPVFNIADLYITIGISILILAIIKEKQMINNTNKNLLD